MNAECLTKALGGRWSGSSGEARCPAHEDKTPSLSIAERAEQERNRRRRIGDLLKECSSRE
jgi:hypothetical protein